METKGIIYYTNNGLDGIKTAWNNRDVFSWCQEELNKIGLPIVSVSLKPMDFGKNIVLDLESSPVTMLKQIITALENIDTDIVFFCEHDVIYNPTHFEFTPTDKDTFYYNVNSWKWDYHNDRVVWHEHMVGLHGLCCFREKALEHFKKKLEIVYERGYDKLISRNPEWARKMGYEPGKPIKNGGISDDKLEEYMSEKPILNIRHRRTMTPIKMDIVDFIRKPVGYTQSTIDKII